MSDKQVVKAASRGGGKVSTDAAMAAFASLAVGFALFAMPADLFESLFGSSIRVRILVGGVLLAFAAVFALLRALERLPSGGRRRSAEIPAEPPRLRRADAHPDAPPRWPIFARHELGAPLPAEQPEADQRPEGVEPEEVEHLADSFAEPQIAAEPAAETETAGADTAEPEIEDLPAQSAGEAPGEIAEEAGILELEQELPGLLAGGIEISDGQPVDRLPASEAAAEMLPSFIAAEDAQPFPEPAAPPRAEMDEAEPAEFHEHVTEDAAAQDETAEPAASEDMAVRPPVIVAFDPEQVAAQEADPVPLEPEPIAMQEQVRAPFEPEPEPEAIAFAPETEIAREAETPADYGIEFASEPAPAAEADAAPARSDLSNDLAGRDFDSADATMAEPEPELAAVADEMPAGDSALDPTYQPEADSVRGSAEPPAADEVAEVPDQVHAAAAPSPLPAEEGIEALAARIPEVPESGETSISDLMGRLEKGLGRSDRARWLGLAEGSSASEQEAPVEDRLRSAIGMLRRMAGRKG
jgi:hypothetical protein